MRTAQPRGSRPPRRLKMGAEDLSCDRMDILDLLVSDHRTVQGAFAEYRSFAPRAFHSKQSVAASIFEALERHARLEEELFYPELETAAETADFVRGARRQHEEMRLLIAELRETLPAEDPTYDGRMAALEEMVAAHVGEEEEEVFPAAESILGPDLLHELGTRAEEIRAELEAPPEDDAPIPPLSRL